MSTNQDNSLKEPLCLAFISKNYLPNGQPNNFDWVQIEISNNYVSKYKITTSNSSLFKVVYTKKELNWYRQGKKRQFNLKTPDELIIIRAEITITIEALKYWIKTWCPDRSVLITPSKKYLSLDKTKHNNEKNNFHDEQLIHYKFHHLRIQGEWFKAEKDLLEYIEKECLKLHF